MIFLFFAGVPLEANNGWLIIPDGLPISITTTADEPLNGWSADQSPQPAEFGLSP